jgi:malate dehydrogenase (oxaloacetate-decarboxylating)(NADP+)
LIAALMLARGEADAMICGLVGRYQRQLRHILDVLPLDPGISAPSAMTAVQNDSGVWFFVDTHVQYDPSAEQIAEATLQAVLRLKTFGIEPRVALLSHSNFGSHDDPCAKKMRRVLEIVRAKDPRLEIDGEMQADTALNEEIRARIFPNSTLRGRANLFVFPNIDAANITYNMVRQLTDGVAIGPILMGVSKSAHVLTPASTVRRVVNMTAIACVEAQIRAQQAAG